jgi:hypothetical protein
VATMNIIDILLIIGFLLVFFMALAVFLLYFLDPKRQFSSKPKPKVKKEQIQTHKMYQEASPSDAFSRQKGIFKRVFSFHRAKSNPQRTVLVRMQLKNGRHKEFIAVEDEKKGFIYNSGRYVFDDDAKYFVIDSNIWAYDYHESIAFPIHRSIPAESIKKALESKSSVTEVENAVDPAILERFIRSEIAQGILRGASLGALFKMLVVLVIIVLLIVFIDVAVDIYASGIIQNMRSK